MSLSPDLLAQAARYLEQHDETQRIQKLIFCLCKKYWENDPNVLNSIPLQQLLQELVQIRPTKEQLTFSMYKLVKTLNRQGIYTVVAKVILDQMEPIYAERLTEGQVQPNTIDVEVKANSSVTQCGLSPPLSPQTTVLDPNFLAERITQTLAQHSEQVRIKKLMFAVGRGYWENDLNTIDNYGFTHLVADLRKTFPTKGELQFGFNAIVQNINKASLYQAIANLILKQMDCLYEELAEVIDEEENENASTLSTMIRPVENLSIRQSSPSHEATAIIEFPRSNPDESSVTVLESSKGGQSKDAIIVPKDYNLFELRLEIMQNTNPLRAKILLFSICCHPWDNSGQDWSTLRSYGLDDLIEQVILSRQSIGDIDRKLHRQVASLKNSEDYTQSVAALLQTLKSVCPS